jgi:hypothetical protein
MLFYGSSGRAVSFILRAGVILDSVSNDQTPPRQLTRRWCQMSSRCLEADPTPPIAETDVCTVRRLDCLYRRIATDAKLGCGSVPSDKECTCSDDLPIGLDNAWRNRCGWGFVGGLCVMSVVEPRAFINGVRCVACRVVSIGFAITDPQSHRITTWRLQLPDSPFLCISCPRCSADVPPEHWVRSGAAETLTSTPAVDVPESSFCNLERNTDNRGTSLRPAEFNLPKSDDSRPTPQLGGADRLST